MTLDDVEHFTIAGLKVTGLRHQLRGMADGAKRIADFMGDACGQSPQRSQFHLLGLLGHFAGVFDEHQDLVAPFLVEAGEAGLQDRGAGGWLKGFYPPVGVL